MHTLPDPDPRGAVLVDTALMVVVDPLFLSTPTLRDLADLIRSEHAAAIRTCWDGRCTLSATPSGVLVSAAPGDVLLPPGMTHWQAVRCMAPAGPDAADELLAMATFRERGQA